MGRKGTDSLAEALEAHPTWKRLSKQKLKAQLKAAGLKVPGKDVDEYYKASEFQQIRVPAHTQRRPPLLITAPPRSFQLDIGFLPSYASTNSGVTAFLLMVDVLSRKAYATPLESQVMSEVVGAYAVLLIEATADGRRAVNSVSADDQFNNEQFKRFNREENIYVYTDVAKDDHISGQGDKLGIVDRCMRTIKKMIGDHIDETARTDWTEWLDDVVADYNKLTLPKALQNQSPDKVFKGPDVSLLQKHALEVEENRKRLATGKITLATGLRPVKPGRARKNATFEPGESVRILLPKGTFDKEQPRWSREVYKVEGRDKARYTVSGMTRRFKPNELLKVPATAKDNPRPKPVTAAVERARTERRVRADGIQPATEEAAKGKRQTRSESDTLKAIERLEKKQAKKGRLSDNEALRLLDLYQAELARRRRLRI